VRCRSKNSLSGWRLGQRVARLLQAPHGVFDAVGVQRLGGEVTEGLRPHIAIVRSAGEAFEPFGGLAPPPLQPEHLALRERRQGLVVGSEGMPVRLRQGRPRSREVLEPLEGPRSVDPQAALLQACSGKALPRGQGECGLTHQEKDHTLPKTTLRIGPSGLEPVRRRPEVSQATRAGGALCCSALPIRLLPSSEIGPGGLRKAFGHGRQERGRTPGFIVRTALQCHEQRRRLWTQQGPGMLQVPRFGDGGEPEQADFRRVPGGRQFGRAPPQQDDGGGCASERSLQNANARFVQDLRGVENPTPPIPSQEGSEGRRKGFLPPAQVFAQPGPGVIGPERFGHQRLQGGVGVGRRSAEPGRCQRLRERREDRLERVDPVRRQGVQSAAEDSGGPGDSHPPRSGQGGGDSRSAG
jgi:hypothetical protein